MPIAPDSTPIGRVVATESHPTSTGSFRFWLAAGVNLKPFDFVRVLHPENTSADIGCFYAIIDEIHQVSDEPSPLSGYISSDFGDSSQSARVARVVTTYADATVLYNTKDIEMPVPHGSRVHWPDEAGVRKALGIDEYRRNTPAGYITMSGPNDKSIVINVDMDADYLVGPEGAHLNISGISGLATKTSYAMFILSAIQQRQMSTNWPADDKATFVILNVKGSDLLHLHELAEDVNDRTQEDWEKCDLKPEPLTDVVYYYPYSGAPANDTGCPRDGLRRGLPVEQAGTDLRAWSGCVGGDVGSPEEARRSEPGSARRSAQELSNGTGTGASWPKASAR